jgi:uncharacterized protein with PIN domain
MPETKITHEGQACPQCGTAVEMQVRAQLPSRHKGQRYYFDYWLRCPGCGATYHMERARRVYVDSEGLSVQLG